MGSDYQQGDNRGAALPPPQADQRESPTPVDGHGGQPHPDSAFEAGQEYGAPAATWEVGVAAGDGAAIGDSNAGAADGAEIQLAPPGVSDPQPGWHDQFGQPLSQNPIPDQLGTYGDAQVPAASTGAFTAPAETPHTHGVPAGVANVPSEAPTTPTSLAPPHGGVPQPASPSVQSMPAAQGKPTKKKKRSLAPLLAIVFAIVGLGALLAVFFLGRGRTGADSPVAAVESLTDLTDDGDPADLLNAFAPSEVTPVRELVEQVYSKALDGRDISEVINRSLDLDDTNITDGLTVGVQFTEVKEVERASEVAVVSVDGFLVLAADDDSPAEDQIDDVVDSLEDEGIDIEKENGAYLIPLDDLVDELEDAYGADLAILDIVTVKEDGRWYISPMLTIANNANEAADGPSPEWDNVGAPIKNGVESGSEAVEAFFDSWVAGDAEELATLLSRPWSRLAQAFPDYVDELQDAMEESLGGAEVEELELSEYSEGVYAVENLEVAAPDDASTGNLYLEDDCWTVDRETNCLFEYGPDDLTNRNLLIVTEEIDGRYVVDPVRSITEMVGIWVDDTPASFIRTLLKMAQFDENVVTTEFEVETDVSFGDQPYVVLEIPDLEWDEDLFDVVADVDGNENIGEIEIYLGDVDLTALWLVQDVVVDQWAQSDEPLSIKVVVYKNRGECGPIYCENDFTVDDDPFSVTIIEDRFAGARR